MRTNLRVATEPYSAVRRRDRWVSPLLVVLAIAIMLMLLLVATLWPTHEARGQSAKETASSILGSWKVACECSQGMVVEIASKGPGAAVGRVKVLGKGSAFKYKRGDEIIRLTAVKGRVWSGQLLWRNKGGEMRWQPITIQRADARLHGVSANEHCYEYMDRAR